MTSLVLVLAFACISPILFWVVTNWPALRLFALTLFGLLGLDSGRGGLIFKALFVCVLAIALLVPCDEAPPRRRSAHVSSNLAVVLSFVAAASLLQMMIRETPLGAWINDATTYAILVACVVAGYRIRVTPREADWLLVIITPLASLAFALTWLSRRGLGAIDAFYVLGSKALLVCLLSISFARAVLGARRRTLAWLVLSSLPIAAVLITGTRSGILFIAPLVAIALYGFRARPASIAKLVFVVCLVTALTLWASARGFLLGESARDLFAVQRLSGFFEAATSGGVDDDLVSGRGTIASDAWSVFLENPVFGVGLGNISGVDSTIITLAKFGVIGTLVLVVGIGRIMRDVWLDDTRAESRGAVVGICVGLIALSLTASVFEDPGLGLALGLSAALTRGVVLHGLPEGGTIVADIRRGRRATWRPKTETHQTRAVESGSEPT